MRRRSTGIVAWALALCVVVALPAVASARSGPPKPTRWSVSIRGTQVTTWSFSDPQTDRCTPGNEGNGDQTISFHSVRSARVGVYRGNRFTHGRPLLSIRPSGLLTALAHADRNGEVHSVGQVASDCPIGGDGGCASPPCQDNTPRPDCGDRDGAIDILPYYSNLFGTSEDESGRRVPERNHLKVSGSGRDYSNYGDVTPLAPPRRGNGASLDQTYEHCPFAVGYAGQGLGDEREGSLLLVHEPLREGRFFGRHRKTIVVDGGRVKNYSSSFAGGTFTGRTVTTWKLTFKPRR